jgi:hypothetical protein
MRRIPSGAKPAVETTSIVAGAVPAAIAVASVLAGFAPPGLVSSGMLSEKATTVPPRDARISSPWSRLKS